jgi:chromosomal replication initiator protein
MNINRAKSINYWTIPAVRRHKLNLRQKETMANEIIAKVCTYYNITNEEIRGKKRYREQVIPRHMAMYLIRNKVGLKLKGIADLFGRDHSTVMHGITSISNQSDVDLIIATDIENLINIL